MSEGDAARTALLGTAGAIYFDTSIARDIARIDEIQRVLGPFADRLHWAPAVVLEMNQAKPYAGHIKEALAIGVRDRFTAAQEQAAEDLRSEDLTEVERRADPSKNLGEAQCVVACEVGTGRLVIHDEGGQAWADKRGVNRFTVIDVLAWLAATRRMKPGAAWRIYERMCANPGSTDPKQRGMIAVRGWEPELRSERFTEFVSEVTVTAANSVS